MIRYIQALALCSVSVFTLSFSNPLVAQDQERSTVERKVLDPIDAAGLALFAVVGASKSFELGYGAGICILMGTMTATAGGLIRDVVCNETPLLLRQDIYATAAILGAGTFYTAQFLGLSELMALSLGAGLCFLLRALAIHFKWHLPGANKDEIR